MRYRAWKWCVLEPPHTLCAPAPVVLLCYRSEAGITFRAARRPPRPGRDAMGRDPMGRGPMGQGPRTLGCPRTRLECESHSVLGIPGGTWNKLAGEGSAAKRMSAGESLGAECTSAGESTRERSP